MTLKDLAPRVGITFSHLANVERGDRELTWPVMERLALVLNVDPADLLNLEDGGLTVRERELIRTYRETSEMGQVVFDALASSLQQFRSSR